MKESGLKFRGVVQNRAHSAGFNLLQSCNWRVGTTGSLYLFHFGSIEIKLSNHSLSKYRKRNTLDTYLKSQSEEIEELAKRTGVSIKKLLKIASRDTPMTLREAYRNGFLDEIVSFYPNSEKPREEDNF